MKNSENILAIQEYGFSCTGELRSATKIPKVKLTAGLWNFIRQLRP